MASSSSSSSTPARSITLRRSSPSEYILGRTQGYLFTLEVIEAVGLDPEIFVFQRKPATGGGSRDEFSNIASSADLEEYPADEPETGGVFYRLATVELVFRNLDLGEQSMTDIERDINGLIESLNQMDTLVEATVVLDGS